MKTLTPSALATSLALIFGTATAAASANTALPPVEHYGAIAYRTGGVGIDEAKAMKADAQRYPLTLEFVEQAGKVGEYSAGELVKIQGAHNRTVFTAKAGGPFMLVNLPDGKYRITASDGRYNKVRNVDIAGKTHDRVAFVWPARQVESN